MDTYELELLSGHTFIIDAEDKERVMQHRWTIVRAEPNRHFARSKVAGPLHRFLVNAPRKMYVDFRDGNDFNCRKSNLKACKTTERYRRNSSYWGSTARGRRFALRPIWVCGKTSAVELNDGQFAIVDTSDLPLIEPHSWHSHLAYQVSYAVCQINGQHAKMHRVIMGIDDPRITIDHRNGDGLDNRMENLRSCTCAQNQWNQRLQRINKTGFKGVSWDKTGYRGIIRTNGVSVRSALFGTPKPAARWYDEMAIRLHGEFAMTNKQMGLL